jgi:hypothetical protein
MDAPPPAGEWFGFSLVVAYLLLRIFRGIRSGAAKRAPQHEDEPYLDMRRKVLSRELLPPVPAGTDPKGLRGVAMDWRLERGVVTLVAVDDAVSMYYSTGGGIIGAGTHKSVRDAAAVWLAQTRQVIRAMKVTDSYPLPPGPMVNFWAIRSGETLMSGPIDTAGLIKDAGGLYSRVWAAAQEVVTALRAITPAK